MTLREFSSQLQSAGPETSSLATQTLDLMTLALESIESSLGGRRGRVKKIVEDQREIYSDIIDVLLEITEMPQGYQLAEFKTELDDLIHLLEKSAEELQAWSTAATPRCLSCGQEDENDPFGKCPDCNVSYLLPVRAVTPRELPILGHDQAELFGGIGLVITGYADIEELDPLIHNVEEIYREFLSVDDVEVEALHPLAERQLLALAEMRLALEDGDAQHLEDGWNVFIGNEKTVREMQTRGMLSGS